MPSMIEAARSQVGRKFLTGITGVFLILFIILHLAGNLTIFGDADAMNRYTLALHNFGWLLWVARIGLAVVFILHAWIGISIWLRRRKARPTRYSVYSRKGEPSKQGLSSRSMAFTGVVLLIFLIIHLNTFAFGETDPIQIDGEQARDLKSLVVDTFQSPLYAFGYTFVMILLGAHLGHGVWSAFTSLTMKNKRYSAVMYIVGVTFAILMAVGFLLIPLYIYFTGGSGGWISG